jgi:DNA-binding SARP family transcriptional activator
VFMAALKNTRAKFHLQVLGAADITDARERPVAELLAHPRRLALLFILAAYPRGVASRDWLSALFWPEGDTESARAALRQALWVLRRDLNTDVVRAYGKQFLDLDHDCIDCDLDVFHATLKEKRWQDALALYHGDFLDGFYLREAPSFEMWVEDERARVRCLAHGAARDLLRAAQRLGDSRLVVVAARHALRFAPTDESLIRELVRAHQALGDTVAALEEYRAFAHRCRVQFELEPSPEVAKTMAAMLARGQQRAELSALR